MSFRYFYKNVCSVDAKESSKNFCKIEEEDQVNNQWWTKNEPYKIKDNTYHIPTIFYSDGFTFPAKDLTNENREMVLSRFESYAFLIMLEEYKISLVEIVSTKVIDIYAEPTPCYPLKVLIEVIIDVS